MSSLVKAMSFARLAIESGLTSGLELRDMLSELEFDVDTEINYSVTNECLSFQSSLTIRAD
jgi:hypothetical protein